MIPAIYPISGVKINPTGTPEYCVIEKAHENSFGNFDFMARSVSVFEEISFGRERTVSVNRDQFRQLVKLCTKDTRFSKHCRFIRPRLLHLQRYLLTPYHMLVSIAKEYKP